MTTESLNEEVPRRSLPTTAGHLPPFASARRCSSYPKVGAVRVLALSAGDRSHDEKRLRSLRNGVRQQRIRFVERQVSFARVKAHE